MHFNIAAVVAFASLTSAQALKGYNYGATFEDGSCRTYWNWWGIFQKAKTLPGTSGFNSARLYTSIQCGTAIAPSEAFQAAIDTQTSLLLGVWASAGSVIVDNEIAAIVAAANRFGTAFADRVVGISVGSEDLYRSSPIGVTNQAGVGANAAAVTDYIGRVRRALAGTVLANKPIGHVDTWTAWVLPENGPVIQASDFLGHNSFPYFETTRPDNSIDQGAANFYAALDATRGVSRGKPVWVTETGWPHTGATANRAVASIANAERYWKEVGCSLFGQVNTFWYTLEDANTAQTEISFGVSLRDSNAPLYDLSC